MGIPLQKNAIEITTLLKSYEAGDPAAFEELMPLVYDQLKKIATNQRRALPRSHIFSPTALVHEAFLKLQDAGSLTAKDRTHFFTIAARTMRWLLADYAKTKKRQKRGEGEARVALDENRHSSQDGVAPDVLNTILEKLERQDPRLCRVVELRDLAGLTIEETAHALAVSTTTVKRDWLTAKAWLARELEAGRQRV